MFERMVYLQEEHAEATLSELRARFTVLQVASPHLAVLRVEEDQLEQVAEVEGVDKIIDVEIPQEILDKLDSAEELFATAWVMRQQTKTKIRPGEGLDWDAEGFEAPDPSPDDYNE
jgi:hypothetical protein